jgi:hypothetical protein
VAAVEAVIHLVAQEVLVVVVLAVGQQLLEQQILAVVAVDVLLLTAMALQVVQVL